MLGWQTSCFASMLAALLALVHRFHPYPGTEIPELHQLEEEYDFIIAGAGSAGAVIANRLSENKNWSVLLLEAGGRETELSQIPRLSGDLKDTDLDWQFRTAPPTGNQSYCLAMADHSLKWARGKVLGGTSTLNAMVYARGNKRDYDHWESLGNVGWGHDNVLKYFKKSEDNNNQEFLRTPYHNAGGYLCVQDELFNATITNIFVEAGKYMGYDNQDFNGKNQSGFALPQMTECHGSRCSTARAFLLPIQDRPNLSILLNSLVTKIDFEYTDSQPRAKSVSFVTKDKKYVVKVKKEIILSAGTINSPKILMLSGVGPKEHLDEHGIKVVKDLKVGYNLQDHASTILTFKAEEPVTLMPSNSLTFDSLQDYFSKNDGPLTLPVGPDGIAFVNSKYADKSGSYPDVQFYFFSQSIFNTDERPIGRKAYNLQPELFEGTEYESLQNYSLFDIAPVVLRPKSQGRVKLHSVDPYDPPNIDPNYFDEREDVKTLIDGLRMALQLVSTPPFKNVGAKPLPFPFPGCEDHELYSDGYLECLMRHLTRPVDHAVGTCAMGVTQEAVVDPQLRVHGVKGLRVIDASVMPYIPSANTNAPTIMVAEKGADMIKESWGAQNAELQVYRPFLWPNLQHWIPRDNLKEEKGQSAP